MHQDRSPYKKRQAALGALTPQITGLEKVQSEAAQLFPVRVNLHVSPVSLPPAFPSPVLRAPLSVVPETPHADYGTLDRRCF